MIPYRLCLIATLTACGTAMSAPRLACMREQGGEKQIVLANADGRGATPLTKGSLWHLYPALDASGTKIAYVEGPDAAHLQVMTRDLKTGVVEQWTRRPGMHLHPRFSGDGRYLAFSGPYGPGGLQQIVIIDLRRERAAVPVNRPAGAQILREAKIEVIPSEFPCYFPAPSSDGGLVVFQRTRQEGKKEIVLWDRAARHLQALTDANDVCMSPALSFDDAFIAYSTRAGKGWDIYVRDRLGKGKPVRVTHGPARNLSPRFGPDGSLVFASDRTGRFQLYRIGAASMAEASFRPELLLGGNADFYAPSLSGDTSLKQKPMPEMPAPARSSFGAVRVGSRIYVAGGHQGREHNYPPESFLAGLMVFDLLTGRWHQAAPRSVPCHGFGLVAACRRVGGEYRDFLYAFGGFTYSKDHNPRWKSLDIIERYDVQADRWEVVGRMPRPRSSNVVAQVGGRVYLIGGWDSTPRSDKDREGRFLREIDVFDLEKETCSTSPHRLPDPLRRAFCGVVVGDEIVLVGGLGQGSSHFDLLDRVTAFRPATGRWRELPRLPFATFAPAVGAISREVFVFGGMFKTGPRDYTYVNHVFHLTPEAARWRHTGRYLSEAKGFSVVVGLEGGTLGILGGHAYQGGTDGPVRTFEVFEAVSVPAQTAGKGSRLGAGFGGRASQRQPPERTKAVQ